MAVDLVGERVECGRRVAISSVRPAMVAPSAVQRWCVSMTARMVGSRPQQHGLIPPVCDEGSARRLNPPGRRCRYD
jgi:hypothetical protein